MPRLRALVRCFWPPREDRALREELEHHRDLLRRSLETQGHSPADADRLSRRAMGNVTLAREDARDVWIVRWADHLRRDVRYGLRGLRREPTFAVAAILTLGLGLATTTTVFSVVDAEVWKPLPFPHSERLFAIRSMGPGVNSVSDSISFSEFEAWRAGAPAFAEMAAVGRTARAVMQMDTAQSVSLAEVTANYLATLGRPAVAGRLFTAADQSAVAVLTDRGWRRLFNSDPSILSRTLTIDDTAVTITGVVRADDSIGTDPDLYIAIEPRTHDAQLPPTLYGAVGRLRPDADPAAARGQLDALAARAAEAAPETRRGHTILMEGLREFYSYGNWRPLFLLLGASLVVFLLSAVNVATLLVGRAFRRTREFALRGAIGGGGGALARQLFVEGALLAVSGAAVGVLLSLWAVHLFAVNAPDDLVMHGTQIPVDLRVCAFALIASGVTAMAFAFGPLIFARRVDLSSALGSGGRAGQSVTESRMRGVLLTAQIALTVILLAGAGLFLKSFVLLSHVPLGFDPANALLARVSLSGSRYAGDDAIRVYGAQALDRVRVTPGVVDAAIASSSPLGSGPLVWFGLPGWTPPAGAPGLRTILRAVGPGYFRTLRIPIVKGREFSDTDVNGAPRVAIVNETFVKQAFGSDDPIGREISLLPGQRVPWTRRPGTLRIVGVAPNVKDIMLTEQAIADVYAPFAQMPAPWIELVTRAGVPAATLSDALRHGVAQVDSSMPVTSIRTFDDLVAGVLRNERFNLLLFSAFAAVAVLLAAIGVFGAVAYNVQARLREFGVRLAMGARPRQLAGSVLWRAGRLGLLGGVVGLVLALAVTAAIGDALYLVPGSHNGMLFGVSTRDPLMLGGAVAGVVLVAALAGVLPARRVTTVDPVRALRND